MTPEPAQRGVAPGEAHRFARLTEAQVLAIRERYAAGGVTLKALGEEYGVGYTTIQKIVRRTRWKETGGASPANRPERPWTERENAWLVAHAADALKVQTRHFRGRRTERAIRIQRSRLGLTKRKVGAEEA